jgi:RNA polymerase sigma-70 factor (ECF subfamily)
MKVFDPSPRVHIEGPLTVEKLIALSARASEGAADSLSFEQIYARWFHEVSRWVRALGGLNADLDDVTQEIFLVVRRKLAGFDGQNLRGWLYMIAKLQVRDYRRRAWVRRLMLQKSPELERSEVERFPVRGPDPSEQLERREVEKFLKVTLAKMTESQRTAFVLFEIEGFSGEEIAELEGIPLNTVWTRLHHARKRFFELIDKARAEGRLP